VTHWFEYPGQHSIAFQLGPVAVHWYGLSYLLGFICVFLWMNRPAGRRRLGLNSDQIQDFLVYALVGVLVGGRIGFVIADVLTQNNLGDYLGHPLKFIAVWEGGMAFHGALIGVVLAIVFFLRKHKGLDFNVLADEIVVLLPIGIACTRVVNFFNNELQGKVCVPDQPYCVLFPGHDGYRYPSQLFEGILDIIVLPVLLLLYRRRPYDGVVAWTWFTYYGVSRTIAELWREPGFVVFGLSNGQLLTIPQILIGVALLVWSIRRAKRTDVREVVVG
jgi:phosphatidylglycerol:prolipoprotein diacylglycerol transferase